MNELDVGRDERWGDGTKDDDSDLDRTENAELVRLLEQPVLTLQSRVRILCNNGKIEWEEGRQRQECQDQQLSKIVASILDLVDRTFKNVTIRFRWC